MLCYISDVVGTQFALNSLLVCFIYAVSTHKEKLELLHKKLNDVSTDKSPTRSRLFLSILRRIAFSTNFIHI
jgi:hypothetical protein